jgi:hypothetical protein
MKDVCLQCREGWYMFWIIFVPIFTDCLWSQNGNTISLSFQYYYKVILKVTLIIFTLN